MLKNCRKNQSITNKIKKYHTHIFSVSINKLKRKRNEKILQFYIANLFAKREKNVFIYLFIDKHAVISNIKYYLRLFPSCVLNRKI